MSNLARPFLRRLPHPGKHFGIYPIYYAIFYLLDRDMH